MLEKTVASIGPMCAMKDQADKNFTHSGQELNYDQYSNIFLSEATNNGLQIILLLTQNFEKSLQY